MARIPAYAYRVIVYKRNGTSAAQHIETHNYTSLPGAWAYRDIALRRQNTRKAEIVMVLDESTPDQRD